MSGTTRRRFLQSALVASAAGLLPGCNETSLGPAVEELPGYVPGEPLPWRNWAENQGCRPRARTAPGSEQELAELLRGARGPIRPVGAGHSFSALVPSDGTLVATDRIEGVLRVDAERGLAEVGSGTRLHALGPALHARGQAMPNLPDIDYQTLGGAVATSTHGTGVAFGSLSDDVVELTLVTAAGDVESCDREHNPELFHAARCSLGALGVVSRLTLRNREPVQLTETSQFEPLQDVLADIETRKTRHRNFELYAFPHAETALVLTTDEDPGAEPHLTEDDTDAVELVRDAYRAFGWIPGFGHPLYALILDLVARGEPTRRTGFSHQILAHPRLVRFREMEYTVPADAGPACLHEVLAKIRAEKIPVVFPIELRYVKRDDVWLSMFHERDGCSISIHQFANEDHGPYFRAIEPIFWKYEGRPHWGKLHSLGVRQLAERYPRFRDFQGVREDLDPDGRFLNAHLSDLFGTG